MKNINKVFKLGILSLIATTTLYASIDNNDAFINQQRIDFFVDKMVEEKNESLINQAKFDKEYLNYLRSKRNAKKVSDKNDSAPVPVSGFSTFNMQK